MERFINLINQRNEQNNEAFNINLFENLLEGITIVGENTENTENTSTKKEFIDSLERIENDKEDLQCSICLEEFKIGEKCIKLPCKDHPHYFHKGNDKCPGIMEWFKKSNTCPVCRSEFPCEENNPIIEEAEVVNEQDEQNDEQQDEVGVETILEQDPLINLAENNKMAVLKHNGFWSAMDTLRDRKYLEDLWAKGDAPWKTWK